MKLLILSELILVTILFTGCTSIQKARCSGNKDCIADVESQRKIRKQKAAANFQKAMSEVGKSGTTMNCTQMYGTNQMHCRGN